MITFCPQCATPVEQRPYQGTPRPTCPRCGYIHFADPKVAATVLIERDGAFLFVRRAVDPQRGLWCLPGGYVDFGEDPLDAAVRECCEETGLTLRNLQLLDVAFNGRVIVITYLAHATDRSDPIAGDDADAVGWFAPSDPPPLAFEVTHQAIKKLSAISRQPLA